MMRSKVNVRPFGLALFVASLAMTGAGPVTESWDAVYIAGNKVGSTKIWVEALKDHGEDRVRVRFSTELTFSRLGSVATTKFEWGTIETPEGKVLRLDTRTLASDTELRAFGDVVDGKMKLILESGKERQEQVLDWPDDVRGPYAAEQSLTRQAMNPGETRELKMFEPDLNIVCDVTLAAKDREEIVLGGGVKRSLLRVEQTTRYDGKPRPDFDVTLWIDSAGQVLKTRSEIMGGVVSFRTTKEGALAPNNKDAAFDQITNSVIKIKRPIPRPEGTRNVRYRVVLKNENPADVIPADRRQTLQPGKGANEVILTVKTAGPDVDKPGEETVDPAYLRPNTFISSEDPVVLSLTSKAVGNATDPWTKAKRISKWVAQNLKNKNFEVTFATASEVARNLSGDCTEHGVLTAAMCRSAGVPARVSVGIVYVKDLGGFGFHLWNEVYVNRRWVAIDPTFDQDTVDAVHIKLADASLDGVSSPFLKRFCRSKRRSPRQNDNRADRDPLSGREGDIAFAWGSRSDRSIGTW